MREAEGNAGYNRDSQIGCNLRRCPAVAAFRNPELFFACATKARASEREKQEREQRPQRGLPAWSGEIERSRKQSACERGCAGCGAKIPGKDGEERTQNKRRDDAHGAYPDRGDALSCDAGCSERNREEQRKLRLPAQANGGLAFEAHATIPGLHAEENAGVDLQSSFYWIFCFGGLFSAYSLAFSCRKDHARSAASVHIYRKSGVAGFTPE